MVADGRGALRCDFQAAAPPLRVHERKAPVPSFTRPHRPGAPRARCARPAGLRALLASPGGRGLAFLDASSCRSLGRACRQAAVQGLPALRRHLGLL